MIFKRGTDFPAWTERTRMRWCIIACVAFLCITNDETTEALRCYDCVWTFEKEWCEKLEFGTKDDPLRIPCASNVLTKEQVKKHCKQKQCRDPKEVCLKAENNLLRKQLRYGCTIDGGEDLTRCTYSSRSQPEENYCKEDLCNGGMHTSTSSIFVLILLTLLKLEGYFTSAFV